MPHYLYILYSRKIDKYYGGESADSETRRILHNEHYFKKNYTKAADDWEIKLDFTCKDKEEALYLERFIKRMKSKKFTLKVINRPQILINILLKR